jgi:hypothetical protein
MTPRLALFALALSLLSVACAGSPGDDPAEDPASTPSDSALSMSVSDAASVLALVNDPAMDAAALDQGVGLDSRAAQNIAKFRSGTDGACPSADDAYFDNLGQLDAIPYVGDVAFQKLLAHAALHPAPAAETVEGVFFRGWQAETVVWAVNHLEPSALDAVIDSRAVDGLVAHRPLATVSAMGPIPYVGPSALGNLRSAAAGWWTQMSSGATLAGSFDGVSFDQQSAETALEIANAASTTQLTEHGMTRAPAGLIVAKRPYATLGEVAALKGVGTQSMQALHDYAASGQWGAVGASACVQAFESAVSPYLPELLLMSESDRPIEVVTFAGAGAEAPTPNAVLKLVGAPAGSSVESRSVDDFALVLEMSSESANPDASAELMSIVSTQLSGTIYVKVHAPVGSPNQAEVHVYLVGRTSCGDWVGLHSVAIET